MGKTLLLLSGLFLTSGCAWPVRQVTNQVIQDMAAHPFDLAPDSVDEGTAALMDAPATTKESRADDVQRAASTAARGKLDLNIPPQVPGSEAPRVVLPADQTAQQRAIAQLYPALPALPEEPAAQPGPEGKPYALADLQRLAAANSPSLRQAVANVEAARGALVQAQTYPNPIVGYIMEPTADNSSADFQAGFIDQVIVTGGKLKLGVAAARQDLSNAELALKRARSNLSTAVRNAYFTLLVDKETLVVTRALARMTDSVYRVQTGLLGGAQAAPYEPAALRAQAYETRLAYQQAIASYLYDWKQLVATLGVEQMPLSEVAGRVDRLVPYYDYDEVLAYILQNHTDVLTARNALRKAQYGLKLAQVTPFAPDVDVHMPFGKDFSFAPPAIAPGTFGTFNFFSVSLAPPIWDQNKGNVIASQGGLIVAGEGVHFAETTLTANLATAYAGYKNNLYAIEAYRRNILPDLTRYYRGIYARRQVDPKLAFNDLVTAQQTLSQNVTGYLGALRALWSSVVSVADFLQTDDLFQLAKPRTLPALPDLDQLPLWPCDHPALAVQKTGAGNDRGTRRDSPHALPVIRSTSEFGAPPQDAEGTDGQGSSTAASTEGLQSIRTGRRT